MKSAFRKIEALRSLSRSLAQPDVLPNMEDAVLRNLCEIKPGTKVRKLWPQHGRYFDGVVKASVDVDSTVTPGTVAKAWTVKYTADNTEEDLEEVEIRKLVVVDGLPARLRSSTV